MASPKSKSNSGANAASGGRWLLLRYDPVALFSLRMTHTTNKGGKTLLVPTPYAFKLALIDACFRKHGPDEAERSARKLFDLIKARPICFRPPKDCVVQNTFVKIRQDERGAPAGNYVPTIAYREWVYYCGEMIAAVSTEGLDDADEQVVFEAAAHINYLGKRGCFWQFLGFEFHDGPLPNGFTIAQQAFESLQADLYGVSEFLDDFGESLCRAKDGFERISSYHGGTIKLGQHRVLVPTLIPYVRTAANRNFTRYQCHASGV